MTKIVYKFVQLSDIHFGQEKDGSLPEHDDVREQLLVDAAQLAQKRGIANLILVVGDTAFAGKENEFTRAGVWLDKLAKSVGCDEKSVRLVPGNHDCDRSRVSEICRMVHDTIRGGTPKSAYGHLEKIAKDTDSPLFSKLAAYRDFAASYKSDFDSTASPRWSHNLEFPEGVTIRLIGLNSVQICDEKDDAGNMILGNTQYIFSTEPHVIPVVLVHHPLKWFMDQAEAETYLHNRAHVVMVGHEHIPKFCKVSTGVHERIDLSSGATNPPEQGALYRHSYNWIEMSISNAKDGNLVLRVEVFARTWSPDTTKFVPDRPRMNDADSIAFELQCPKLKPRQVVAASEISPAKSNTSNVKTSHAVLPKRGDYMEPTDDDVAQLRFLFWRHLDWRQRLKALVEADVLPVSADKPVPQSLERLAIEQAREHGKLAALWDAMLPLLPVEHRKENPFKKR